MAHLVEVTLDAMGWGGLYDEVDGGFFRYAATRDWQSAASGEAARRQRGPAQDVCRGLRDAADRALSRAGGRRAALRADVARRSSRWRLGGIAAGRPRLLRRDAGGAPGRPRLRRSTACSTPGGMPRWCRPRSAPRSSLDDTALGEFALKSLERIVVACYSPGAGIAHCLDGRPSVRGLLDDQIAMAAAHLDAHAATGNIVYEMMAQELAHYAVRTMWDEQHGGFFDRSVPEAAERVGLMRERLKPFVANCDAARVLKRLAAVQRRSRFRRPGRRHARGHGAAGRAAGPPGRALPARASPADRLMEQPCEQFGCLSKDPQEISRSGASGYACLQFSWP